jgi:hypothetical protein
MKDVGHIDEKGTRNNIWIRHLRSFERNHDAFDLGIDNMIDEWTRMGDTPNLKRPAPPPTRVSGMLFEVCTRCQSMYLTTLDLHAKSSIAAATLGCSIRLEGHYNRCLVVDLHIDGKTIPNKKQRHDFSIHVRTVRFGCCRSSVTICSAVKSGDLESVVDEWSADVTQEQTIPARMRMR